MLKITKKANREIKKLEAKLNKLKGTLPMNETLETVIKSFEDDLAAMKASMTQNKQKGGRV